MASSSGRLSVTPEARKNVRRENDATLWTPKQWALHDLVNQGTQAVLLRGGCGNDLVYRLAVRKTNTTAQRVRG